MNSPTLQDLYLYGRLSGNSHQRRKKKRSIKRFYDKMQAIGKLLMESNPLLADMPYTKKPESGQSHGAKLPEVYYKKPTNPIETKNVTTIE